METRMNNEGLIMNQASLEVFNQPYGDICDAVLALYLLA